MKKTRFTEEQRVAILREADERPVPEVAKKHGVSAQTIYGWRKHFGTLQGDQPRRGFTFALGSEFDLGEEILVGKLRDGVQ
jgi:transposase-like protein